MATLTKLKFLIAVSLGLVAISAQAAAAHTKASLVLAADLARPGDTVLAGVQLHMDPSWHTYWKNSGASGIPTKIEWQLPVGVTAGATQWPMPEKLPDQDLTTYIYKDDVFLLTPLKLATNLAAGALAVKAKVSWLECEVQCVPGSADVQASLTVGPETKLSKDAPLLEAWQKKLPQNAAGLSARARWERPTTNNLRPLILEWTSAKAASGADFFPDASEQFEVQPDTERIPAEPGKIALRLQVKKFGGDWPAQVSGLVLQQSGAEHLAWEVNLPVQAATADSASVAIPARPLWEMLLFAFLGGLILNVMPCVLPVIALKILGFVGQAKDEPRRVRRLGLVYALGVLASFAVLAGLVIGLKAAGHHAAWGMQFGNSQFLVVLTVLVTLVALNLFGLFEINPGGAVLGAAGTLASKHGAGGAFFNGVLATVLATPCTAPILGTALGFAFAPNQHAVVTLAIFLTVGVGLALPYVLLSWQPAWLKFLPRPGLWMLRFKVLMGFPMLATAVWLFSLIPVHYGTRTLWLGIFLVVVALAAWVFGEFVQRACARRGLGLIVVLALLVGGYLYAIEGQLQWRSPITTVDSSEPLKASPDGIDWQRWSPEAVAKARAEGRPVLVDFTADWCLTCQANKRLAIEIPSVRSKLKEMNAVALLADYTRAPDNITEELNRFGRAGVPLVLVYPRDSSAPPIILPEALTKGIVLNALERCAKDLD